MLIRLLACAGMGAARLAELAYSRHNVRSRGRATEGTWTRRTFPLIVAVHAAVILGTALRGRHEPRRGWLAALVAVQPLRAWVLLTLGSRWNARAAVPEEMTVETSGPYAFVRHPNYTVVAVELLSLPMAFGLPRLALAASLANAALLACRIPEEEAALMRLPGYREHFGVRARFLPGIV